MRIIIFLCLCLPLVLTAQPKQISHKSITDHTFSQYTIHNPVNLDYGVPTVNQIWDYTDFNAPVIERILIETDLDIKTKSLFPNATFSKALPNRDCYYQEREEGLYLLGSKGYDPIGLGIKKQITYTKPAKETTFPLEYGKSYEGGMSFEVVLDTEEIPVDILKVLPVTPSKMKIEYTEEYIGDIDAEGHLFLPKDHQHEVFRERRYRTVSTTIKIKLGFFSWIDVSSFYKEFEGLGIGGKEKIVDHLFWANDHTFPVLVLNNIVGNSCQKAIFQSEIITAAEEDVVMNGKPYFGASPNPAISLVEFQLLNIDKGRYTIRLMNIIGQTIWEKPIFFSTNRSIRVDTKDFPKGTYLYILEDEFGKTVSSKRLIIIKP